MFPNLAAYNGGSSPTRPDIVAILLTGLPPGVIPGFTNYNGTGVRADQLRLNTAIPPAASPSNLGLLGTDLAGFPNGRRVFDDVATIELRALAGATLPSSTRPSPLMARPALVSFGLTTGGDDLTAMGTERYLSAFPYLGHPYSGWSNPAQTPTSVSRDTRAGPGAKLDRQRRH